MALLIKVYADLGINLGQDEAELLLAQIRAYTSRTKQVPQAEYLVSLYHEISCSELAMHA